MFNKKISADKKKKQKAAAEELSGIHIYKDDHNRFVYYDVFSHSGYILNNIASYRGYSSRFIIGIIAAILAYTFELGYIASAMIGVGIYIFLEIRFRIFLKKQVIVPNFKRKERPARLLTASKEETNKIYLKIVLYLAFAILIIILPFTAEGALYDTIMKVACILIGIGAIGVAIFQVFALLTKKKNEGLGK